MTDEPEAGGDAPCWAEQFDATAWGTGAGLVVSFAVPADDESSGAVWSLPHGGDLDANVVHLAPHAGIGSHVNDEVDVLIVVHGGDGTLTVDGARHRLGEQILALVPRGSERSIDAGPDGLRYLSVHRRRAPLGISRRPGS